MTQKALFGDGKALPPDGSSSDLAADVEMKPLPCDKKYKRNSLISERMKEFLPWAPRRRRIFAAKREDKPETTKALLEVVDGFNDPKVVSNSVADMDGKSKPIKKRKTFTESMEAPVDHAVMDEKSKPIKKRKISMEAPVDHAVMDEKSKSIKKRKVLLTDEKRNGKKPDEREGATVVHEMPAAMRERIHQMGGYRVELVIQKILTLTDLNRNHGRLLMPPLRVSPLDFLTDEEKTALGHHVGKSVVGINVPVVGPSMKDSTLKLKAWKVGSRQSYCFTTGWNEFARENGLAAGDTVQVWSFRTNENGSSVLHFCFVKVESEEHGIKDSDGAISSSNSNNGSDGASSSNSKHGSCLTEDKQTPSP